MHCEANTYLDGIICARCAVLRRRTNRHARYQADDDGEEQPERVLSIICTDTESADDYAAGVRAAMPNLGR